MTTNQAALATFSPIESADRHESAPLLPHLVTVYEDGAVVAVYEGHPDVGYADWAAFLSEAQASASELIGPDLDIATLRTEAGAAGDTVQVALCDAAITGDTDAIEACANARIDALLS